MTLTLREAYIEGLIDSDIYYFAIAQLYGLKELERLVTEWAIFQPNSFVTNDEKGYEILDKTAFQKFLRTKYEVAEVFDSIVNRVNHETMFEAFNKCGGIELYRKNDFNGDRWIDISKEVKKVFLSIAYRIAGIHVHGNEFYMKDFEAMKEFEANFNYYSLSAPDDELYNEGDCDR